MGLVRTEITLISVADEILVKNGHLEEREIRRITVEALVDTGAWTLVINEAVREKLGLQFTGTHSGILADGSRNLYKRAGPLEIRWKDRSIICEALVLPDAGNILLGAIPLEGMDLTINPLREELVGAHGDEVIHYI
jgi:clan AA aspartic protease